MNIITISPNISVPATEVEISAVRAQGAGGQHVNKVATGIHLRFDIHRSSLPDQIKQRLLQRTDHRITNDGIVIIKSQQSRSQEQNRINACKSLEELIKTALVAPKKRLKTKPGKSSVTRRLETKTQRGKIKDLRQKIRH
jgi:ribosome-associated protein